MKKIPLFLSVCASVLVSVTGCTTANEAVKAAAAKNVNAALTASLAVVQPPASSRIVPNMAGVVNFMVDSS